MVGDQEARVFVRGHMDTILEQLEQAEKEREKESKRASQVHIVEMFVERERLLEEVKGYRERII